MCRAQRFRFADTLGLLDPFMTFKRTSTLREAGDPVLEMHATTISARRLPTLTAVLTGASHINTTVTGLGKRAGNVSLATFTAQLGSITREISRARPLAVNLACLWLFIRSPEMGVAVSTTPASQIRNG